MQWSSIKYLRWITSVSAWTPGVKGLAIISVNSFLKLLKTNQISLCTDLLLHLISVIKRGWEMGVSELFHIRRFWRRGRRVADGSRYLSYLKNFIVPLNQAVMNKVTTFLDGLSLASTKVWLKVVPIILLAKVEMAHVLKPRYQMGDTLWFPMTVRMASHWPQRNRISATITMTQLNKWIIT